MLRRYSLAPVVLFTTLINAACFGEPNPVTLDQPIAIVGGTFRDGALPGVAPETEPKTEPRITSFELSAFTLRPGQQHIPFIGRATEDTAAIGLALEGVGDGYWVHTSSSVDPQYPGERIYDFVLEVGDDVPAGPRRLLVVALDDRGNAGTQSYLNVCIASRLPDNGHACSPQNVSPAAIVQLQWSEDVDLDLAVRDPGGQLVDREAPALLVGDRLIAQHSTDSNAGCRIDGNRVEHVVWPELPAPGLWSIHANLFDPCGHSAVTYRVTQYRRQERGDGLFELVEVGEPIVGRFLRAQANGDVKPSIFVAQVSFE